MNSSKENPIPTPTLPPLDFSTVVKVPDSHKWDATAATSDPLTVKESIIPVIDLTSPDVVTLIRQASEEWGMFQVTNHGIPLHLFHQIEDQTRSLFALPIAQKLLAARPPGVASGYGRPRTAPLFTTQFWHEGFTILGSDSPAVFASKLWPNQHTIFSEVIGEYQKEMKALSEKIIGLVFESLGLTQEDVDYLRLYNNQSALQLNSYPVCPEPDRAIGLVPHTDSSVLTLVHQAGGVPGLQIFDESTSRWATVQPMEGALVVDLGDFTQIISNGRFKSVQHQAVPNKIHQRISVAYFYLPPKDVKVSPSMKLMDDGHPLLYRPVLWKEYCDTKATLFNKAIELIKT